MNDWTACEDAVKCWSLRCMWEEKLSDEQEIRSGDVKLTVSLKITSVTRRSVFTTHWTR